MPESNATNQDGNTSSTTDIRLIATLRGHETEVDEARFSPDGALLVSADNDHTVRLWDVRGRTLIRTLDVPASNLTFSPDGTVLAWTTIGGFVQLRTPDGELTAELPSQGRPTTALAFSPDGSLIAAGDELGHVRLWETASRHRLLAFLATPHDEAASGEAAPAPVDFLRFVSDGTSTHHLAAVCRDPRGNVHLWDIELPEPSARRVASAAGDLDIGAMAVSPDGHLLAVADFGNGGAHFLDTQTLARRGRVMVEDEIFKALAFSPDGHRVALAGGAGMVYLWDITSQRIVARIAAHTEGCDYRTNSELWALGTIDWSSDGRLLVTTGTSPFTHYDPATRRFTGPDDYTVKLWNLQEVDQNR